MRRAITGFLWAVLILIVAVAAGIGVVVLDADAARRAAAMSNELLGWWVQTAMEITRQLRG